MIAPRDTLSSLLEIVERDRDERCRDVRKRSEEEARAVITAARGEAREHVTQAASELRRTRAQRIEEARAALASRARLRQRAASRALLEEAWRQMPEALRWFWSDEARREQWLAALLSRAGRTLPLGNWRIEHPVDWAEAERSRFAANVRLLSGSEPELVPDRAIIAGARIVVGSACLDATAQGLLADGSAVQGRLLAEMWREAEGEP